MAQTLVFPSFQAPDGAQVDVRHGRRVAVRFSTTEEEYEAIRRGAALFDWSTEGVVVVEGRDRVEFLHRILTQDIKGLAPGRGAHAALVTSAGKIVADVIVLAGSDRHWLLTDGLRAPVVTESLERYLFSEDVRVSDRSTSYALLTTIGEGSNLGLLEHVETAIEGVPVTAMGWGVVAAGVTRLVPADARLVLWRRLLETGRASGIRPVGWDAINIARVEAGIPWCGLDFDETHLLPETGLETAAVSSSKGCYIGQEIIARMDTYGSASRKLMTLRINGTTAPDRDDPIVDGEQSIGAMTSACRLPDQSGVVGLGYVKRPFYEAGRQVEVLHAGSRFPAVLGRRDYSPR